MGLIEEVKIAGEQATASARETLAEAAIRRDLNEAYGDLGRATFKLICEGTVSDRRLIRTTQRVRVLETELAALIPDK